MRRLFVILLILTVPLRALGADVMATWMLGQGAAVQAQAGVATVDMAADMAADMPPDCPMMRAAAGAADEPGSAPASEALQCQACHAIVALPAEPDARGPQARGACPAACEPAFASATPPREERPPIS